MTLLVTGASGGLGRRLVAALAERPLASSGALRLMGRRAAPPDLLAAAPGAGWVRADLLDPASLERAVSGASVVLHLAAETHSRSPRRYREVNVVGTRNLAREAVRSGVGRFVHMSTRALGEAGGAYCHSKELAERAVRESGVRFVLLRPGEVYGFGPGAPGDAPRDPILQLARTIRRGPFVAVLGDGSAGFSPVHVDDVVRATLTALAAPAALDGTYTLTGPETMSFVELVARIEALLGVRRRPRVRVPVAAARAGVALLSALGIGDLVPDQVPRLLLAKSADITAARRDLGFAPRTLAEGLAPLLALPELLAAG